LGGKEKMNIKFVNYDGCFPNLCSGILTLNIDGKDYTFGRSYMNHYIDFPRFWCSGGSVSFDSDWNESVTSGERELSLYSSDKDRIEKAKSMFGENCFEEFLKVMNENVKHGCCGGCV
jgi:hypothetical protein